MHRARMAERIAQGQGFIAALDQSGGSTPKALRLYGHKDSDWADEAGMFDLIHAMRCRIMLAPAFTGDRVLGAILFEQTAARTVGGLPVPRFLWQERGIVPFLKIDRGLEPEADGCQLMKPMPGLEDVLARAVREGIFGTKERSVIGAANAAGIRAVVDQQFAVAHQVLAHGLMPIVEPEVTISIPDKVEAETILRDALLGALDSLAEGQRVMLKLTLPSADDFYALLVDHPRVLRVVALSGGYSRAEANAILARNRGVIASFSRALTEGLSVGQSQEAFEATLEEAIASIAAASAAG